ncbi:hypothetical protein [Sutcliffiella horikoshii]|uniref:hypothetical protein n=1 Tax=Sutcliffiella horikoshii TaxID=79883 RepID=UPI001CFD4BA1|nr:hypothetical protein [Sutcliffiella horikoshii]
MKKNIIILIFLIAVVLLLHSTPHTALRTYVFFSGYPIVALTTDIVDDEYHNRVDKEKFEKLNGKAYTLTKPPIEKATQGELRNYLVRKFGIFHFVEFIGEV